ncbi:hypothetical protein [Paenibacillus sp. LK1]|uniref:hypothetical protein n=1 Tax=Paenibacillus sp. LK1 TaxID=2053014 RepID=UPI000C18542E|nr:hypothetical protein [Paenibacillus sp. LK1]PIH61523.1 hypothetical protein CS562_03705 [Paenibacillus sp. LK1]
MLTRKQINLAFKYTNEIDKKLKTMGTDFDSKKEYLSKQQEKIDELIKITKLLHVDKQKYVSLGLGDVVSELIEQTRGFQNDLKEIQKG